MIAFGVCIGERAVFERYAAPGLARAAEADSALAEIEARSIFEGYNEALDCFAARAGLEALVLLHEDVEIGDAALCDKLRARLADPGVAIVGAVGASGVRSLCWWEGRMRGRVAETRGVVGPGPGHGEDVDAVDGLLLALSPWAVRNLRFDAASFQGFHGYDVDICLQARAAGRRVVVEDLGLFHHTRGGIGAGEEFWAADAELRRKWSAQGLDMASDPEMAARARSFAVAERA